MIGIGLREIDKRLFRELKRRARATLGLRNTFGDRVVLEDHVEAWMGDKRVVSSKGHIVNQGLIGLINLMAIHSLQSGLHVPSTDWSTSPYNYGWIYVGTGTGVTTGSMTSLVTPNTTKPDSQSGATASPATGTYRVSWISTWNAGTLPAIDVSEMGLYLILITTLQSFGVSATAGNLFSRLSDSDGDFTTFTVNTAVPLTIEWRLTLIFA